jgi:hypothetical protein
MWVSNNYTNSHGKNKIAPYLIFMLWKVTSCIFLDADINGDEL